MRHEQSAKILSYKGSVADRQAQWDTDHAKLLKDIEMAEAEVRYWRSIGNIIEKKVSLAQSVLSNIGAQMKSGMYFNDIK